MAYVDTEKLKGNIRVNLMPNVDIDGTVTVENAERYFLNLIDKTSTADVAEVKLSRWENISGFDVCNICGTSPAYCEPKPNNPKGYPPYCHNCGAKMKLK